MVTFQVPAGPKNLQSLFPGVDFTQVDEYYLQLQNQDDSAIIMTTNRYKRACCCNDDTIRLFFVNYLGGIDAINLNRPVEETETVSSSWKKPLKYPLEKWDGGKQRFNVTSNETVTAENICFGEDDQACLKELLASPNCWVQWTGTQSQDDDYIPVVIKDGKFVTKKRDERYIYVLEIEFEYSNDNIILRN
jgi:hypothetical protein